MTNKISTSILARSRPSKTGMELFKDLEHHKFIKRDKDKKAVLTNKGLSAGGSYASKDDGKSKYIVWPEDIVFPFESVNEISESERISTESNYQSSSSINQLKVILNKKNLRRFNQIDSKSIKKENLEYQLLYYLIGDILKYGSINLESFTKNLWEMIFNDNIDINDQSLMKLFPACDTMNPNSCEAFFWKYDQNYIKERLIDWKSDISKQVSSGRTQNDLVLEAIAKKQPKTIELLNKIPKINKTFTQRYGTKIIELCQNNLEESKRLFLCRRNRCKKTKVIPRKNVQYTDYNIYEWFEYYGVSFQDKGKPTQYDFPIKLSGYFNRLKDLKRLLNCKSCKKSMIPNWRYAKSYDMEINIDTGKEELVNRSAAYRVTVFHCNDEPCGKYRKNYKLSHCISCGEIIDSRHATKTCPENLNICKDCYACCQHHLKLEKEAAKATQIYCPDCGQQTIRIYKKGSTRWSFCVNRNCDHKKNSNELDFRFFGEYINTFTIPNKS